MECQHLLIKARLASPLMIHKNRQSNVSQGNQFLPGSSLRGAVAARMIRTGAGPEQEDFRALFIENPVRFPDLLPSGPRETLHRVLPFSSLSCKRSPGFPAAGKTFAEAHGVYDRLAVTAVSRMAGVPAGQLLCPRCKEEMKPFTGFWNAHPHEPRCARPTMFFRRHTGISRATGTVALSMYYISQAIADYYKPEGEEEYKPQYLVGTTTVSPEQAGRLKPYLGGTLFAGADRTSGMGELEISIQPQEVPPMNLTGWNRAFKEKLKGCKEQFSSLSPALWDAILGAEYFSVTLESHALLVDAFLRPTAELHLDFPGVEPVARIARSHIVRGWQAAWGLPKPDDTGLEMGSVYLFKYNGNLDTLTEPLTRLTHTGIGLRREEGFGAVQVNDPFHVTDFDQ